MSNKTIKVRITNEELFALGFDRVIYNGKEWKGINPEIGMVFQKLALMPFKTVIQNVELALKFRGMDKEKRREERSKKTALQGTE